MIINKLMSKVIKIFNMIKYSVYSFIPDKLYLQLKFRHVMKKNLDLNNPQTFNEKLQWLKLYDRRPEYTTYVDKFKVREYISKTIGEDYLIPLLGVWNSPDEIDFDKLPNQFVLKCNHDSGGLCICKDKASFDIKGAKDKLRKSLKKDYYLVDREWPYKNVQRKIIAEKYMVDESEPSSLRDYKFMCFDGKAKAMFIASDRQKENEETKFDFFDMDFKFLDFTNGHPNSKILPQKPNNFNLMKELSEKLSKNIPQIRVDLYEINGKVYFGELTLYHWSGLTSFKPEKWDFLFGEWIKLPCKKIE